MQLQVKKLSIDSIPTRAYSTDSGLDITACLDKEVVIQPGERKLISTGIAIKLPDSTVPNETYEGTIRPRSGNAVKYGLSCHFGTIDNSYIGEIKVLMYNFSDKPVTITPGMKIAQLVVQKVYLPEVLIVYELGNTERSSNGFGSTDI